MHEYSSVGKVADHLALLLLETVLEEHEHWNALGTDLAVFHQGHHAVAVHRLAGEELELLEAAEDVLHGLVHVGLEDIDLVGGLLLQLGQHLLHVVLQVEGVGLLVAEGKALHQAMVQHHIDSELISVPLSASSADALAPANTISSPWRVMSLP